jgi:1-deoxy-D-xylulose-5-phosphate reductoisomerase
MNAANEAAVSSFTSGKIPFGMISRAVSHTIARHTVQASPSLDDLMEADRWARKTAQAYIHDHAPLPH